MTQITDEPDLSTQAGRLRHARLQSHFSSMRSAAQRFGWNENTYKSHELGIRRGGSLPEADAKKYARAFRVSAEWLLTGRGSPEAPPPTSKTVPLVGYVGAGAVAHYYATGDGGLDDVPAPQDATPNTVAAEIRGESLGPLLDGWLVFWDEVRNPPTPDMIGQLCVVGLPDDRVLVKQLKASSAPGRFHLLSNTESPIFDAEVLWAAKVKGMGPR